MAPPNLSLSIAVRGPALHFLFWASNGPPEPVRVQVLNLLTGNDLAPGLSGLLVIQGMNISLAFGESLPCYKEKNSGKERSTTLSTIQIKPTLAFASCSNNSGPSGTLMTLIFDSALTVLRYSKIKDEK